jgi:hypothetical protein
MKKNLVSIVILVLIFGGIGTAILVRKIYRDHAVAPFKEHLAEYASLKADGPPARGTRPKGKFIPIDMSTREVDRDIYFDMPDDVKPATPDEVGTVVQLQWNKVQVDQYTNGKGAFRQDCMATVFDRESKKALAGPTLIEGEEPPQSIKSSESGTGKKPVKRLIEFVQSVGR